jgi:hypothetical protein
MTPRFDRRTLLLAGFGTALVACSARASGVDQGAQQGIEDGEQPPSPLTLDDDTVPATMAMVGDSITVMSTPALQLELPSTGLDVRAIDAQIGRRIAVGERGIIHPGVDVVRFIGTTEDPDLWVIALGANDIGKYDRDGYDEIIREMLRAIPFGKPLVWVNAYHEDEMEHCELFNAVLDNRIRRRERSLLVDWFSHGDDDGVVTSDGVHPTEQGIEVFARITANGVTDLLASL